MCKRIEYNKKDYGLCFVEHVNSVNHARVDRGIHFSSREMTMKQFCITALAAVFCLTLLGCGDGDSLDGAAVIEPSYQGKPLSEWVEMLSNSGVSARRDAAEAIGRMGESAVEKGVPALEEVLAKPKEDGRVRINAAMSIIALTNDPSKAVPGLIKMLRSQDLDVRYRGALALEKLGPAAAAGVPVLEELVETYSQRNYASLTGDEQLVLATARGALKEIQPEDP